MTWVAALPASRFGSSRPLIACGYVAGEFVHHDQWKWDQPYERLRELLNAGGLLASRAAADRDLWLRLVHEVDEKRRGLIVSHGGSIEPVLVAAFPHTSVSAWGRPFAHLDNAVLTVTDGKFTSVRFHRFVPFDGAVVVGAH
jgi:broad specificity phosphatase PhoE